MLRHAAEHVPGVRGLHNVRTRWIGHRMHAEADVVVDAGLPVRDGMAIAARVRASVMEHLPALGTLSLALAEDTGPASEGHGHSHGGESHSHEFLV